MIRLPVSAFIIAVNEADRIARTIKSVQGWVDEVIVIDSGSTDETVKVSQEAGARVIYHQWPGYGEQKRFGEEQCRNRWVLNLDADEVISPLLAEEIQALFTGGTPAHSGYTMDIVQILPGRNKPHRLAHRVRAIRLYDRTRGRFHHSTVHDTVYMDEGTTGTLRHIVEHRSLRDLTQSMVKINRYSSMQADNMIALGVRPRFLMLRLLIEFPLGFLKAYIFRAYFLAGLYGFVNSVMYGFSRFIRLAKYWEKAVLKQDELS